MSRSASVSPHSTAGRDRGVAAWSLSGGQAHDRAAHAVLDLTAPASGLVTPAGDRLLGFDIGEGRPPIDAWVRGDDITAIWEPGDDRGLRATGLWRAHPADAGLAAWELVASATTRQLRADATLAVSSVVAAAEILSATWHPGASPVFSPRAIPHPAIVLVRRGDGRSVLMMLHPSEHQTLTVVCEGGRARVECALFPAGVEKGVLLRSRVFAAVGPTADEAAWSPRLAAGFAASPPLLST